MKIEKHYNQTSELNLVHSCKGNSEKLKFQSSIQVDTCISPT